jgi:hypothetical protein
MALTSSSYSSGQATLPPDSFRIVLSPAPGDASTHYDLLR